MQQEHTYEAIMILCVFIYLSMSEAQNVTPELCITTSFSYSVIYQFTILD